MGNFRRIGVAQPSNMCKSHLIFVRFYRWRAVEFEALYDTATPLQCLYPYTTQYFPVQCNGRRENRHRTGWKEMGRRKGTTNTQIEDRTKKRCIDLHRDRGSGRKMRQENTIGKTNL